MNNKIKELGEEVAKAIPTLFAEASDSITESINVILEDAKESETGKAVLSLPIKVQWDLNGSAVVVTMPVQTKRKFEVAGNLPDHTQTKLPFVEGGEDEA